MKLLQMRNFFPAFNKAVIRGSFFIKGREIEKKRDKRKSLGKEKDREKKERKIERNTFLQSGRDKAKVKD